MGVVGGGGARVCVRVCVGVVCVCVCVWVGNEKGIRVLRGVGPRHLCVRPPKYPCTSISAMIIDMWPTEVLYC